MTHETCKFFLVGACRNGARCRFAHDDGGSDVASARVDGGHSRERCKFFASANGCTFGDRCRYAHDDGRGNDRGGGMRANAAAYAPMGGIGTAGGTTGWRGGRGAGRDGANAGPMDDGEEEWGYVDEHGNWVSFDDEGDGAREFLAAQLPDEDDLLGLTSETPGEPDGGDAWGFYDENGQFVELSGEAGAYLQTQEHSGTMNDDEAFDNIDDVALEELSIGGDEEDERVAASANLECAVCLEVVAQRPRLADRRFGLLNACDHIFCLGCIRGWRQGGTQRGSEASASSNEQARMCPICRVTSHFITPATTWPRNADEKKEMTEAYLARMKKIPCRFFDGGDGTCPFGTSCFYEHRYRATGELEESNVRKSTAADGSLNIITPVRLSDFLQTSRRLR